MEDIIINDSTLRDGSHAVKHQLTLADFQAYAEAIDKAGIDIVEVGTHGNGLGASSIQMGEALHTDREVLHIARQSLQKTKLGILIICGYGTIRKHLKVALDEGVDVFRVASLCTEADTTQRHIEFLANENKEVCGVLTMTHLANKEQLLEQAIKMQDYGAKSVILMDSAGTYLPNDVQEKIGCLVENMDIPVGFHAHNNFGMGVANSLIAVETGAKIIDATACGFGAGSGNTALEVLVTVLQKMGYRKDIDLFKLLDAVKVAESQFINTHPYISEISLLTAMNGLFSGFSKPVLRASKQFNVNYRDIFNMLGDKGVVGGQEDLIIEIASELSKQQHKLES